MTTPASDDTSEPDRNAVGSGFGLPTAGSGSPDPAGDIEADAVVAVPVEVPVPVPIPVPVPATSELCAGKVINRDPTTADDIAALVLAVPDVVRLHAGRFGEVATYLPGRRITGVKLGDNMIEVHVVVAGQVPVRATAYLIHAAVAMRMATPVHVYVEDVAVA